MFILQFQKDEQRFNLIHKIDIEEDGVFEMELPNGCSQVQFSHFLFLFFRAATGLDIIGDPNFFVKYRVESERSEQYLLSCKYGDPPIDYNVTGPWFVDAMNNLLISITTSGEKDQESRQVAKPKKSKG